ncbi:MAG: tripartite tricarboxylate transporter TctB family protein [Hyphomicrobiaceae bacterium]|nr:tripartite tricarboxylate transporter TctB family protein [Hyphomicrobiaceae bacterium]
MTRQAEARMIGRMPGAALTLLGLLSMLEGLRIQAEVRETATFDSLGPDRYLMVIAALMTVFGLLLAWKPPVSIPRAESSEGGRPLPDHLMMLLALIGFATAIPLAGFDLSALGFFLLAFLWVSRWRPAAGIPAAIVATAALHVIFVTVADVALPKGLLLD